MSIEDLTAFFTRLENDTALQERVRGLQGAGGPERLQALSELAAEQGFEVTPEDWEHEDAGPAVAALEDETLSKVVGGTSCTIAGDINPVPQVRPLG